MKILICNPILFTPNANVIPYVNSIKDTMIYGMCKGFRELGHTITLVAAEEYAPKYREEYDFDVLFFKSHWKKVAPPSILPLSFELFRYLKFYRNEFDLVISSEVFSFNSLFASILCPQKTIIWQELTTHQKKMHQIPSRIWHNIIAHYIMSNVHSVVARSEMARKFIRKYMHNVSDMIIDHGINIENFIASNGKKRQIISSSQLIKRKNIVGIIRIFEKFHKIKGCEDIKLIIAGRGEEEENLKKIVHDLDINDCVQFVGFLTHKRLNEFIRESYVFLVNTKRDLNMVSIPESIVSGTPILTNCQPSSADYIDSNELGIAKNNWNEYELKKIVDNNKFYVQNCINYRENLTSKHAAQMFVDLIKT